MVGADGVGDVLQHHRLAGFRRRDDQAALAGADRGDHVDDPAGDVLVGLDVAFELQVTRRVQRRQVLEHDLVLVRFRRETVDRFQLGQRDIAFAILRGTDFALDGVAGAQVEAPDLRRRDIDVVGVGEVGGVRRAEEAEAVLQHFERAVAEDRVAVPGLGLQDRVDQLLLAHAVGVLDGQFGGHVEQFADV